MGSVHTPSNRLDSGVTRAWRVQILVVALVALLIAGIVSVGLGFVDDLSTFTRSLPVLVVLTISVLWITVVPAVRYRRWRWEVTEHEVRLQKGLIVVERTIIPMARVQHVDTSQGPIMGAFGLSEVRVWTAAGPHSIPALADEDASRLRDRIAVLARVMDDGGL